MFGNNMFTIIAIISVVIIIGYILAYNRLQRLRIKIDEAFSGIDVALEKRFDLLSEQIEAVKKYLSHEYKLFTDVTALRTGADQEEKSRLDQKELTEEAIKAIDGEISKYSHDMEKIKGELQKASNRREGNRHRARERDVEKRAKTDEKLTQTAGQRTESVNQKVSVLTNAHSDLSNVSAGIDALSEQYPMMNSWVAMDKFQINITNSEEHLQAARRLYNSNVSIYNQTIVAIPWSLVAEMSGLESADFYEIEDKKRSFSVNFD